MAAVRAIKGIYRNGKVELIERADVPEGTEVVVAVPVASNSAGRMITYGMFSGPPFSTEDDFKAAEWHGEPEFWEENRDARR